MDISVIIPLYNEEESLPELYAWIERVMKTNNFTYEVIFINDGSTDHSWNVIQDLSRKHECVKGIKFRRNYGKSPALYCGFKEAQGDVVITMDADLQDSPDEIPELYRMITEDGYDLVSGYKQKRYDPLSKTIPTKLFNATARKISGIKNLHDFNCGLKSYRRDVVKNIEVYGEMHRYIPYLAKNAGFDKIGEKVVHHQARKYGKSKFGLNRFFNGYLDLITLWFLSSFGRKPMHVFGFLGTIMFFIGFVSAIIIGVDKLYSLAHGIPQRLVTESPYFYIALTMMGVESTFFTGPSFISWLNSDPTMVDSGDYMGAMILISVVMTAPDYKVRFADAAAMLNLGFGSCQLYTDSEPEKLPDIPVEGGIKDQVSCSYKEEFRYLDTTGASLENVEKKILLPESVQAPVNKGDKAGTAEYYLNGEKIGSTDLIFSENCREAGYMDCLEKVWGIFI